MTKLTLFERFTDWLISRTACRRPDFIIGGSDKNTATIAELVDNGDGTGSIVCHYSVIYSESWETDTWHYPGEEI